VSPPEIVGAEVIATTADRPAWLAARAQGIGASEVAAVLGLSPWSSALEVYAAKRGLAEPVEETERMRWGTRLEAAILAGLADDRHAQEWPELDGRLLRSREWPWMLATPDGWLVPRPDGSPIMCELKTSDRTDLWAEVPAHVWTQVQAQMAVTGQPRALVAVLLRGHELRSWEVARDPEAIADIVEACRLFWERVKAGDPPPPDGSPSAGKALARLYPRDDGEAIDLAAEIVAADERIIALREQLGALETEERQLEQQIKAALGTATTGRLPSGARWTHKLQSRKASACPACSHVITPASEYRVLRRSEKKAKG
jgi:putative phage-type endonuclease